MHQLSHTYTNGQNAGDLTPNAGRLVLVDVRGRRVPNSGVSHSMRESHRLRVGSSVLIYVESYINYWTLLNIGHWRTETRQRFLVNKA